MRPRVGCRNLVSRLKQVVLPAPFRPRRSVLAHVPAKWTPEHAPCVRHGHGYHRPATPTIRRKDGGDGRSERGLRGLKSGPPGGGGTGRAGASDRRGGWKGGAR